MPSPKVKAELPEVLDFALPAVDNLIIGKDRLRWGINRAHLLKSQYFRDLLACDDPDVLDDEPATLDLPDEDPWCLRRYLHFLVTRTIAPEESPLDVEIVYLTRLYVYGEDKEDTHFTNLIMRRMFELFTEDGCEITGKLATSMYEGTQSSSPGRTLFTDIFLSHGCPEWLKKEEDDYFPSKFLLDVVERTLEQDCGEHFLLPPVEDYLEEEETKPIQQERKGMKRKANMLDTGETTKPVKRAR